MSLISLEQQHKKCLVVSKVNDMLKYNTEKNQDHLGNESLKGHIFQILVNSFYLET